MTKREKTLGLGLLIAVLITAHLLAGFYIKNLRAKQLAEIESLETTVSTYTMMNDTENLIRDEVDWVDNHTPPLTSFQNAQTDLQNFLVDSSKGLGFSPYAQKLISPQDEEASDNIYENVRIQISARATEKQIYQWLVKIHQPTKMRMLNYVKLSPPQNDTNLINCQIIAEQIITPK